MDEDTRALIILLCTRIDMVMEDASVIALSVAHAEPDQSVADIQEIERARWEICALVDAAKALL